MGTPIVFLPGHMCDERLFAAQMDVLGSVRDTRFFPLIEGSSMAAYARGVLDAVAGPMILAGLSMGGLSMGGLVAMEVLRQARERVEGVATQSLRNTLT